MSRKPQKSTHTHTHTHTNKPWCVIFVIVFLVPIFNAFADTSSLDMVLNDVRGSCSGISESMNHLKTMAGINTAVTTVGTVAGGVALRCRKWGLCQMVYI